MAFAKAPNAVYGAVSEFVHGGLEVREGTEKSVEGWVGSTQLLVKLDKCSALSYMLVKVIFALGVVGDGVVPSVEVSRFPART